MMGEALIGTGGRTPEQNPDHIVTVDQRLALDIIVLAPESRPPELEKLVQRILSGKLRELYKRDNYQDNTSHYCFGR